jgi:serine/threonine-protein kinase
VKLIDFGISKMSGGAGSNTKLTQTGTLLGTPSYMSPEQARGVGDIDHRTDIYSMGVILFQMLTGALPFKGDNYNALLVSVLTEEPPLPRRLRPEIPANAEALVLKELSKDPADRSQTAAEMLEALRGLEAFAERESGLSLLGTRIKNRVASGDLGSQIGAHGAGSSASRVLSQMAKGTPGAWAGTAAKKGTNPALVIGLAAAALVVAGLAAFFLVKGTGGSPAPVVVPAVPPSAARPDAEKGVQITVKGAPEGATIIYEGAPVPTNPFRVKRTATLAPLRVEAPGFEPFAISVVPEKDAVVDVAMKLIAAVAPALPAEDAKTAEREHASKKNKKKNHEPADTAPVAAPTPTSPKTEITENRRGALVTDKFE